MLTWLRALALSNELAPPNAVISLPCNLLTPASYTIHTYAFRSRRDIDDVPVFRGAVVCFPDVGALFHLLGVELALVVIVADVDSDPLFLSGFWSGAHAAAAVDCQSCVSHAQLVALLLVDERVVVEVVSAGLSRRWLWSACAGARARVDVDFGIVAGGVDVDVCLFRA